MLHFQSHLGRCVGWNKIARGLPAEGSYRGLFWLGITEVRKYVRAMSHLPGGLAKQWLFWLYSLSKWTLSFSSRFPSRSHYGALWFAPDHSFWCPSCFTFRVISDSSNDFGVEKEYGNNTEKFGAGFTTSDLHLDGSRFESRPEYRLNWDLFVVLLSPLRKMPW
jgi:hypothetical protein